MTPEAAVFRATHTGSTATCTVSLFYSWLPGSGDQTISQTYNVVITNPTSSGANFQADTGTLCGAVEMPPNNGTVSKTVNVTL